MQTSQDYLDKLSDDYREALIDELFKSLVAISGLIRSGENPKAAEQVLAQPFYESGFMLEIDSPKVLAVITAGHVIRDIRTASENGDLLKSLQIQDRGPSPEDNSGVPVRKEKVLFRYSYQQEHDPDYGAMLVPPYEAHQIYQGGAARPIHSSSVAELGESFEAYFLLGFPSSAREMQMGRDESGRNTLSMNCGCPMLSVTPIVGHNYQLDVRQRFIAKMDTPEDPGLSNIKGMSGGPIWGVREGEEGGLEIRLVAIQSSWDRNYKVILGEYAMPFLNEIRGWLKTPETVS